MARSRATFKVELICIVDANDRGMLVARTEKYNIVLPSMRMFHWMKRGSSGCICGVSGKTRPLVASCLWCGCLSEKGLRTSRRPEFVAG